MSVHNVQAVLPDRIVDDAVVVIEDGVIVDVESGRRPPAGSLDGRGALCLPGLVDSHSDGLEKEPTPRPGVDLPLGFALRSFEGRVRAAGITTIFHGVAFEDNPEYGRTVDLARRLCGALEERRADPAGALVDHRILHRLDARDPAGVVHLAERLGALCGPSLPLVSFEDHTPGQGQYKDLEAYTRMVAGSPHFAGMDADVETEVAARVAQRDELAPNRERALAYLVPEAAAGRIRLLAHDPTDAADIAEARSWSASVAEFPTSEEAARAAIESGMPTVSGAPNVLRGGSHNGNVSAEQLVRLGLCSGLASDYQPSSLLAAAFLLAQRGATTLPAAVALVSDGPARLLGLHDRGRLEPGLRGDLILVTCEGAWPTVRHVVRAPDPVLEAV